MATATSQVRAPVTTGTTIARRLTSAANTVEELEEQLRIARTRRDELIAQAYDDEGMRHRELEHHTRLSRTSLIRIIAGT